jgi:7-carboxy-7-deazaguanine synthase
LKIAEIFYSLQGEGSLMGVPSVFVRTSGCNLRCSWCDTPYTSWRPEGDEMTLDQIAATVERFPAARHVVVTGGEPMIQPEIVALTARMRSLGKHITMETAGTVFQPVACDLMSISPKLANSTPEGSWGPKHEKLRIQRDVLLQLMEKYEYQLKFVIERQEDLDEVWRLVSDLKADATRVVLMPEGVTRDVLRERSIWLAEVAKQEGVRFSPRLHVELWGDKRGV